MEHGKDFDGWNDIKKDIHASGEAAYYHVRDVRWCLLGTNIGYEQDGSGQGRARPVLVLKAFSRHVCLVVPLTTSQKKNPYHRSVGTIGGLHAFAIISQIRLVDTRRLGLKICTLEKKIFEETKKAVKDML